MNYNKEKRERENKYCDIIDVIGIVPIAAPDAIIEKGFIKSIKDVSLNMDLLL